MLMSGEKRGLFIHIHYSASYSKFIFQIVFILYMYAYGICSSI